MLCDWLCHRASIDVRILQETHWGLGKSVCTWQIPGWSFVASADPGNRYSGVAVAVSTRVAPATHITFCSWIPGRILHVRCESSLVTLDIFGVYQFVWSEVDKSSTEAKRHRVLTEFGRVIGAVPLELNLAPWRHGPRHKPVQGSVPWVAGWVLQRQRQHLCRPQYCKFALQECVRLKGPELPELQ